VETPTVLASDSTLSVNFGTLPRKVAGKKFNIEMAK
jgi:hypothetical protein